MDMTVGQDRIFVHQECDRITVLIHVCMPYKKIKNEKSLKLLFAVYVISVFIPRPFFKRYWNGRRFRRIITRLALYLSCQ